MGGNLHLPRSLGTNGLSEHPAMVEIHTHVAAAPHLWVKEASKEQHREGGTEGDIHTHNPYKYRKALESFVYSKTFLITRNGNLGYNTKDGWVQLGKHSSSNRTKNHWEII